MNNKNSRALDLICIVIASLYIIGSILPAKTSKINTHTVTSTEGLYFAISQQGNLISWGNNEHKLIGNLYIYPYVMRKTILKQAVSVSAGYNCVMAVDKNNVLWGWGNPNLLLTDQEGNYPVKVMEGVRSVCVGTNHIGAIMNDASLLVWGYNSLGQLGLGYTDAHPTMHEPKKIMDSVKSVFFDGDISFAITVNDDLYAWGGFFLDENGEKITTNTPTYVASNIQDIAYQSDNVFQLLQTDGTLMALDLRLVQDSKGYSPACTVPLLAPGDVEAVFRGGVNMRDHSCWTWEVTKEQVSLVKQQSQIILEDRWFKVSEKGFIYSQLPFNKQFAIPHSYSTLDPHVRTIFLVLLGITIVFKKLLQINKTTFTFNRHKQMMKYRI